MAGRERGVRACCAMLCEEPKGAGGREGLSIVRGRLPTCRRPLPAAMQEPLPAGQMSSELSQLVIYSSGSLDE